ncbi:hypothetical protein BJX99DRAFT_98572 [Aspergillus californicus]
MSLSWPWHFIFLSETEKQQRRELLTLRGYYAQLSILLAIVLLRLYTAFFPSEKARQKPTRTKGSRQKSWLDSPLFTGWFETRKQYLLCLIWLSWLLGLSMWRTGDDYLHLTKSIGHVGLSQLPLQVAMSPAFYITSTPRASSLLSILASIPQATITAYHRLFARVVLLPLLASHAILYCAFFVQSSHPEFSSLFFKRIRDMDVQLGIAAVVLVSAVVGLVRPKGATGGVWRGSVKERRQMFYIVHVILVCVFCLAIYFHVEQARAFVGEGIVVFLVNLGCCALTAQ